MTLHDVGLLTAASEYMPSLRMWVAAIAMAVGIEPPQAPLLSASGKPESKYTTGEEFARLVKMTGGGANL